MASPGAGAAQAAGGYANPLAGAHVTPERIDQGVDYAGTGSIGAIARAVITKVLPNGQSGWPGAYVEYQVTDPKSKVYGQSFFAAEGVTPTVKVGDAVNPGQTIATLIPGWSTGIELGLASGVGSSSYAAQHGGYTEGHSTAAGEWFSNLVKSLGGPAGIPQSGTVMGTAPSGVTVGLPKRDPVTGAIGSAASSIGNTISSAVDVTTSIANFLSNPVPALLTVLFVVLGGALVFQGTGRLIGFDNPLGSAARAGAAAGARSAAE